MRLLVDAGGTHTRCALQVQGQPHGPVCTMCNDDFRDFAAALTSFLGQQDVRPDRAALAVAAPLDGDLVTFTNRAWRFSRSDLQRKLGLQQLELCNDFTAVALSLPYLATDDWVGIGGGAPVPGTTMAVLGPGTGLGVSGLLPRQGGWAPISGEGGHVTLPARTDEEAAILAILRSQVPHASAEELLCGQGLLRLYRILAELRGLPVTAQEPAEISALADAGDELANDCLEQFLLFLGTVSADLALTLGARGGVWLAGGILPRMQERVHASGFRSRFEDRGRYRAYVEKIPTRLILERVPALLGLAALLDQG